MNSTLYPCCAVIAWLATGFRLRKLIRSDTSATDVAVCATYGFLALTFTTGSSLLWTHIDRLTGIPELSTLITHGCVICFSGSSLSLLAIWVYSAERARRYIRAIIGVVSTGLVTMIGLFFWAEPRHQYEHAFIAWYGDPIYGTYLVVFLTVAAVTLAAMVRLCWRFASRTRRPWYGASLVTTGVGAAVIEGYALTRYADVIAAHLHVDLDALENVAEVSDSLGAIILLVGLTMPAWGPCVGRLLHRLGQVRDFRQLRPLWSMLYEATPTIALDPPPRGLRRWLGSVGLLPDFGYRLTRRVVEIYDGRIGLRDHLDESEAITARRYHSSRGAHGADLDAAVEATLLIHAVRRKKAGDAVSVPAPPALFVRTSATPVGDPDQEVRRLVRISRALRSSPLPPDLTSDPLLATTKGHHD